jgi:hypothetical protein
MRRRVQGNVQVYSVAGHVLSYSHSLRWGSYSYSLVALVQLCWTSDGVRRRIPCSSSPSALNDWFMTMRGANTVLKVKTAEFRKTTRSYGFQRPRQPCARHPTTLAKPHCTSKLQQPPEGHPTTASPSAPPCLLLPKYRTLVCDHGGRLRGTPITRARKGFGVPFAVQCSAGDTHPADIRDARPRTRAVHNIASTSRCVLQMGMFNEWITASS